MTLDPDVAIKIKQKIRETGEPAKKVMNDLLRAALFSQTVNPSHSKQKPVQLPVFKGREGLMPGFSWDLSTSQTFDYLDELDIKGKL